MYTLNSKISLPCSCKEIQTNIKPKLPLRYLLSNPTCTAISGHKEQPSFSEAPHTIPTLSHPIDWLCLGFMPWPLRHLFNWCPCLQAWRFSWKRLFITVLPAPQNLQGLPSVQKINSMKWQSKPLTNGTGPQVSFQIITQLLNLRRYLVNAQKSTLLPLASLLGSRSSYRWWSQAQLKSQHHLITCVTLDTFL